MKLKTKIFSVLVFECLIICLLVLLSLYVKGVSSNLISACSIALIPTFCFLIVFSYITTIILGNKRYLQWMEKWDTPKAVYLQLIIVWIAFVVFYYYTKDLWWFTYGIGATFFYLTGLYIRNVYRRKIKE